MKAFILNFTLIFFALQLYASGEINVKKYGAKGDGKTDDTKAINAAFSAASPLTKTIIYFPAGIYNIASYTTTSNYLENYSLLLHSNLDIKGDGKKSIIRIADHIFDKTDINANAHLFYGTKVQNIGFSLLLIDMNGSNNLVPFKIIKNHAAIFAAYGSNFYIHDITIKNCPGTNMINIMGKGMGLVIENCKFINGGNYVGSSIPNKNQYDFSFLYSEWDSTIVRNSIIQQQDVDIALGNYSGGIELHGSFSSASGNLIEGCWPAIYVTSSSNDTMKNVTIKNNRLINCVSGVSFWLVQPMINISIDNNHIQLTYARTAKNNLCAGIIIPNGNAKEYNKTLANAAPINNLQIKGNTFIANSMKTLSAGMVLHSLQQSSIQNNVIAGMNYGGIVLSGSKWGIRSLLVTNNIFRDFRPNNDKNAVAGYVIITDMYSPGIKDAPGYNGIVFSKNIFLRTKEAGPGIINAKGKFMGAFIAIPSKMMGSIKFINNQFSDSSEKIHLVKTD